MLSILAEPTLIMVFVGITLLAQAMLPFVVNHLLVASPAVFWSPAHLFLVAAFSFCSRWKPSACPSIRAFTTRST
jgi:hypothetical protein